MSDSVWKPTVAELPAERVRQAHGGVGHGLVQLQRPLRQFGGEPARPFVGLVEVDVVERDADAQRPDHLDRFLRVDVGGGAFSVRSASPCGGCANSAISDIAAGKSTASAGTSGVG